MSLFFLTLGIPPSTDKSRINLKSFDTHTCII
jgi:hypothetical protein